MKGLKIRLEREGETPLPVLLLPGLDGTGEMLIRLNELLSTARPSSIVRYPDDRPLSYDGLTEFALSHAPAEPFVVLGESFSGPVAVEIAAREKRVAGLILASSFVRSPVPRMLAPLLRVFNPKQIPAKIIHALMIGPDGSPALKAQLDRILARLPPEIIRLRIDSILTIDRRERLKDVTSPILCLQGRFDRLIAPRFWADIAMAHSSRELCWIDGAHMLLETHAEKSAGAINAFCERLGTDPRLIIEA